MELPTKKDLEDMVENIYQESKKVFKYHSTNPPTGSLSHFLLVLNTKIIFTSHPRLEKDRLILRFYKDTSPYQILTTYIYTLAFIKYDNTINTVGIEMKD